VPTLVASLPASLPPLVADEPHAAANPRVASRPTTEWRLSHMLVPDITLSGTRGVVEEGAGRRSRREGKRRLVGSSTHRVRADTIGV
jgi:hypothetical protein